MRTLPLTDPMGRQYRINMTEKMAASSGILCKAVKQSFEQENLTALSSEAYYSTMLDGASNDHLPNAIQFALKAIHRPIDETLLDDLMKQMGVDSSYRTSSPRGGFQAEDIPICLSQICSFLQDNNIHPLIKASVCHAYILVLQPYSSANGRLARLLSWMILVRSGFTFMLSHSMSQVIANHRLEYIEAVKSAILPNQAGDLTWFVEFSLDMLVETLEESQEESQERSQKRSQEKSQKSEPGTVNETKRESSKSSSRESTKALPGKTQKSTVSSVDAARAKSLSFLERFDVAQWSVIIEMRNSRFDAIRKTADIVEQYLRDGILEFNSVDWMNRSGMTYREFDHCRKALFKRRVIINVTPGLRNNVWYMFCLPDNPATDATAVAPLTLSSECFWGIVNDMEYSKSERMRCAAGVIRSLIASGISEFTSTDWMAYTKMNRVSFTSCRIAFVTKRLVTKIQNPGNDNRVLYRFTLEGMQPGKRMKVDPTSPNIDSISFHKNLNEMLESHSETIRSAGSVISEMISDGVMEITFDSWMERTKMSKMECRTCMSSMVTRQMIMKIGTSPNSKNSHSLFLYRFTCSPESGLPLPKPSLRMNPEMSRPLLERVAALSPIDRLPDKVIALQTRTHRSFKSMEWAAVNHLTLDQAENELNSLVQMGFIFRNTFRGVTSYWFRYKSLEDLTRLIENEIHPPRHPENHDFWTNLALLEFSRSSGIRKGAAEFYRIIEDGISFISNDSIRLRAHLNHRETRDIMRALQDKHLIIPATTYTTKKRFEINPVAFQSGSISQSGCFHQLTSGGKHANTTP